MAMVNKPLLLLLLLLLLALPRTQAQRLIPEACRGDVVTEFPRLRDLAASGKGASLGADGGHWSACTHLEIYGFNFAVFFARFLAYGLRPRSVLEFGCGLGLTADFLARFPGDAPARVVCLEPEPMLAEVFGGNRTRTRQLAVDVFSHRGRACQRALAERPRFDLVLSLEVAEHVDARHADDLVTLLAACTAKYLVFSAARPGQGGTGHLKDSLHKREWWVERFEAQGLVHMPLLSKALRNSANPERGYDLASNVVAFRRRTENLEDSDAVPAIVDCKYFHHGGCPGPLNDPAHHEPAREIRSYRRLKWVEGHCQALWPELDLLFRLLKDNKIKC